VLAVLAPATKGRLNQRLRDRQVGLLSDPRGKGVEGSERSGGWSHEPPHLEKHCGGDHHILDLFDSPEAPVSWLASEVCNLPTEATAPPHHHCSPFATKQVASPGASPSPSFRRLSHLFPEQQGMLQILAS